MLLAIALRTIPALAQSDETSGSSECCPPVLFGVGAKSVALGQAVVADTLPDAVFINPAGLAGLRSGRLAVTHIPLGSGDQMVALSLLVRPKAVGTFGLSYELVDLGEVAATDENGNQTGTISLQQHVVMASFATALGAGLSAGVSYKVYIVPSGCHGNCGTGLPTGVTPLIDAGLQFRPRRIPALALGAAVVNAGLPLQIVNYQQSDQPPTRVRVGGQYEVLHHFRADSTLAVWLYGQAEAGAPAPNQLVFSAGGQFSVGDAVFLRLGWHGGAVAMDTGPSMGIGLRFGHLGVSVAKSFGTSLLAPDQPFHVSLDLGF